MPAEKTRLDSVREYLTGASSDGGAQTNQALCLGNFRSSTEAASYGISIASAIANITVNYASGGCAPGAGSLQCVDANTLQWQDSRGGGYGPPQSLSNGQTIIIEHLGDPGSFLRVTRTSATALVPGISTITLTELTDNVFSGSDVSSADALAGLTTYRATMLRNEASGSVASYVRYIGLLGTQQTTGVAQLGASGAGTITTGGSFLDWPAIGFAQIRTSSGTLKELIYYSSRTNTSLTVAASGRALLGTTNAAGTATDIAYPVPGMAIGLDSAGPQAFGASIQIIANETTAPTGITWNLGISLASGLTIGTLTAGQQIGCWFKRAFPAGAVSFPTNEYLFQDAYDAA